MRKDSPDDGGQLRERAPQLGVSPVPMQARALLEVQSGQHLPQCGEDGAPQQPCRGVVVGLGHDQFGQHGPGLAEDLEALGEGLLRVVLALLGLGDDETAEGAQAVGGIVHDDRERPAQFLAVGVVRSFLGRDLGRDHREQAPDVEQAVLQGVQSGGQHRFDVHRAECSRVEPTAVLQ